MGVACATFDDSPKGKANSGSPLVYFVTAGRKVTLSIRDIGSTPEADASQTPCGKQLTPRRLGTNIDKGQHFADLMRSAQEGDRAAYKRLLEEITPLVRRMVQRNRSFLPPSDIDDLVQNILLALHSVRATYDPCRPFLPWLMAIARNQLADGARRYLRRIANETIVEKVPETFSGDGTNGSNEVYGDQEALSIAIGALPRGQRRAIELLKLQEMTLKDAAVASGKSVPALKVAVHRAMRTLRRALSGKA